MAKQITLPAKYVNGIEVKNGDKINRLSCGDLRATFDEIKVFKTEFTTSVEFWLGSELVCSYFVKPHLARRFEVAWSHISDYIVDE